MHAHCKESVSGFARAIGAVSVRIAHIWRKAE